MKKFVWARCVGGEKKTSCLRAMTMFVSSLEISSSSLTSIPSEARDSLIAHLALICRYVVWWKKSTPASKKHNSLIAHLCIRPCEHVKYKLESSVHYTSHLRYPMTTYLSHERHKILQMLTELTLAERCFWKVCLLIWAGTREKHCEYSVNFPYATSAFLGVPTAERQKPAAQLSIPRVIQNPLRIAIRHQYLSRHSNRWTTLKARGLNKYPLCNFRILY